MVLHICVQDTPSLVVRVAERVGGTVLKPAHSVPLSTRSAGVYGYGGGTREQKPGWTLLVLAIRGLDPAQKHITVTHSFPSDFYRLFVTSSSRPRYLKVRFFSFWGYGWYKKGF